MIGKLMELRPYTIEDLIERFRQLSLNPEIQKIWKEKWRNENKSDTVENER